ncbi:hypothetical protein Clacol_001377 [Clathrus columnatus]|uniref:Uncharacterized protein n=1 Tax=Clathrus columnatus TaxID=1419009 RepID=A0AAV5A0R4_9AGAM|nr:hypothetical protein Clacol_001377 [Clathrus columnatus]
MVALFDSLAAATGSIYVRIPRTWPGLKHLFTLIMSFTFLCLVMGLWSGTLQLLGATLLTYFLAATFRGHTMPWIVFTAVMGHLTISHIYRALNKTAYETFEISGPQMVLTMKLTTFAWNVFDGRRPVEELDAWQKKNRVVKFPSLLEFLGYAILVGPSLEYMTYASLIDGSLFASSQSGDKGRYVPRGRKRVAYTKLLIGFISLGIYVSFSGSYTFQVASADAWLSKSPFMRIMELQLMGTIERCKYYAVWLLAEVRSTIIIRGFLRILPQGAAILTGLGFDGYTATGGSRWSGAANVDILEIELPSSPKTYFDAWNMKTNIWLRETIYKRVARKGKKPGFKSTMCTFVTSAFWHGIGFGYYLAFVYGGFVSAVARQCRRTLRPYFVSDTNSSHATHSKRLYDIMGTISTTLAINFAAAPFFFSRLQEALEIWKRVNWYGLWMIGVPYIFFTFFKTSHTTSEKKKEVKGQISPSSAELSARSTPEPFTVVPVDTMISKRS